MPINLSNKKKRDAQVSVESVRKKREVKYIDEAGKLTENVRFLKSTLDHSTETLLEKSSLDKLAEELIKGDPEIDFEKYGKYLTETSRIYAYKNEIVYHVKEVEVVTNPDGTEKERRERDVKLQNTNTDTPIPWSGVMIPKKQAIRKFVFNSTKQIMHTNGLTWDFLFEIASELHKKKALMLVGAGAKGNEPLVFQRGGKPYRGFLEGRIKDKSYVLLLHLSNMELKTPDIPEE
ncbi:MAG: hypothetical protein HKN25_04715 [Pyrinomonadaceae bacterium]|nr:hypothetical protein [Pyrinomonadaceae bacterium]